MTVSSYRMHDGLREVDLAAALGRPPWRVASTKELATATNISFARLSNWIVRGQWIQAEPKGLYKLTGNKSVFRIDKVTEFLSGISPEQQAHDYLTCRNLEPDARPTWDFVRMVEGWALFPHVWRPRDKALYLAGLGS